MDDLVSTLTTLQLTDVQPSLVDIPSWLDRMGINATSCTVTPSVTQKHKPRDDPEGPVRKQRRLLDCPSFRVNAERRLMAMDDVDVPDSWVREHRLLELMSARSQLDASRDVHAAMCPRQRVQELQVRRYYFFCGGHFHRSTCFYAQHRGDTRGSWRHAASPCYHEVMSLICFAFLSHAMWAPVHAVFFMMYHTLSPSATLVTRCSFRRVTRGRYHYHSDTYALPPVEVRLQCDPSPEYLSM